MLATILYSLSAYSYQDCDLNPFLPECLNQTEPKSGEEISIEAYEFDPCDIDPDCKKDWINFPHFLKDPCDNDPDCDHSTNNVIKASPISINPNTRMFVDAEGRSVIFHGINVVYKVPPYIPSSGAFDSEKSLNDEDIANLVKWGFNFVRLGVMWEAVEQTEGIYDEKYLNEVEALVKKLGEAGIYTLIDMHQDAFSRVSCGEGFP